MKKWIPLSVLLVCTVAAREALSQTTPPLALRARRGFEFRETVLRPAGGGLHAHGRLCRVTPLAHWPAAVRLDLLNGNGDIVAEVVHALGEVSRLGGGCVIYDLTTPWTPTADQTLRLTGL